MLWPLAECVMLQHAHLNHTYTIISRVIADSVRIPGEDGDIQDLDRIVNEVEGMIGKFEDGANAVQLAVDYHAMARTARSNKKLAQATLKFCAELVPYK